MSSRLSIEDPFETWYNVSHFLKESRQEHIRMEFARAYSLCCQEGEEIARSGGALPTPSNLLSRLCEVAPPPPFLRKEEEEDEGGEHLAAETAAMG